MTDDFNFEFLTPIPEDDEDYALPDERMRELSFMAYVYCNNDAIRMEQYGNATAFLRQMTDIDLDHYIAIYRVVQWGAHEGMFLMPASIAMMAVGVFLETARRHKERGQPIDGYVYILRAESGQYKIGRSKNPSDRLKTFSVKLPFRVEYEIVIPSSDHRLLERKLHERFAEKWIDGEWFSLAPEDIMALRIEYGQ
jgi:hypothetical protein